MTLGNSRSMINSCSGVIAPQTIAQAASSAESSQLRTSNLKEISIISEWVHFGGVKYQHYFRVGPVWRGTATRTRTGRVLARQSSNVSLKMSAPMCKRSCRTVLRHYSTHEDFLMKDYFQFLRCSVWSARLGQRRTTNNFRTNFTRSNITLGRSLVLNYNLLCNLIWYILYRIKSNLTYTGQLAKDTSSQLKELNSYPPEQALDPRWSLMETLRWSESLARWWS